MILNPTRGSGEGKKLKEHNEKNTAVKALVGTEKESFYAGVGSQRLSPDNFGIKSTSEMRVEMVKGKRNTDIQFLLLPEFPRKHSCPEIATSYGI